MAEEITQTQETEEEVDLTKFNEPEAGGSEAGKEKVTQETKQPEAGKEKVEEPAKGKEPEKKQEDPNDPYAKLTEGLTIPKDVSIDEKSIGGLKEIAKKHNISVDALKEIVQLDINNNAASVAAEDKLIAEAQAKWAQENQAEYGDNLKNVETDCSRVLAELDKDGKFKELLANAGVEKHPALLGFLKAVGDSVLEKQSVNPNSTISTDEEEVELENFN